MMYRTEQAAIRARDAFFAKWDGGYVYQIAYEQTLSRAGWKVRVLSARGDFLTYV